MAYDIQKYRELRDARNKNRQEKARKTFKKNSTGRKKGLTKNNIRDAKNLLKNATPLGLFSLIFQMKPFSDWMYGIALLAAVSKDILDIISATGIGYILVLITTLCVSILIAFMMLLGSFSSGYGRSQQKIIRSWLILGGGTTIELIFGVNFLPIETTTVVIIYALMLSARKQAKIQPKSENETLEEDSSADDYEDDYAEAA